MFGGTGWPQNARAQLRKRGACELLRTLQRRLSHAARRHWLHSWKAARLWQPQPPVRYWGGGAAARISFPQTERDHRLQRVASLGFPKAWVHVACLPEVDVAGWERGGCEGGGGWHRGRGG